MESEEWGKWLLGKVKEIWETPAGKAVTVGVGSGLAGGELGKLIVEGTAPAGTTTQAKSASGMLAGAGSGALVAVVTIQIVAPGVGTAVVLVTMGIAALVGAAVGSTAK